VLDVARVHRGCAARRNGDWELLETPELRQAEQEIKKLKGALDILSKPFSGHASLTPRERAALAQIVMGDSNKEAARALGISSALSNFTVRTSCGNSVQRTSPISCAGWSASSAELNSIGRRIVRNDKRRLRRHRPRHRPVTAVMISVSDSDSNARSSGFRSVRTPRSSCPGRPKAETRVSNVPSTENRRGCTGQAWTSPRMTTVRCRECALSEPTTGRRAIASKLSRGTYSATGSRADRKPAAADHPFCLAGKSHDAARFRATTRFGPVEPPRRTFRGEFHGGNRRRLGRGGWRHRRAPGHDCSAGERTAGRSCPPHRRKRFWRRRHRTERAGGGRLGHRR